MKEVNVEEERKTAAKHYLDEGMTCDRPTFIKGWLASARSRAGAGEPVADRVFGYLDKAVDALCRINRCHRCDPAQDSESLESILSEPDVADLVTLDGYLRRTEDIGVRGKLRLDAHPAPVEPEKQEPAKGEAGSGGIYDHTFTLPRRIRYTGGSGVLENGKVYDVRYWSRRVQATVENPGGCSPVSTSEWEPAPEPVGVKAPEALRVGDVVTGVSPTGYTFTGILRSLENAYGFMSIGHRTDNMSGQAFAPKHVRHATPAERVAAGFDSERKASTDAARGDVLDKPTREFIDAVAEWFSASACAALSKAQDAANAYRDPRT